MQPDLALGGGDDPRPQPFGLGDAFEVRQQPREDGLEDIGSVVIVQAAAAHDGVDEPVALHQRGPGRLLAATAARNQGCIVFGAAVHRPSCNGILPASPRRAFAGSPGAITTRAAARPHPAHAGRRAARRWTRRARGADGLTSAHWRRARPALRVMLLAGDVGAGAVLHLRDVGTLLRRHLAVGARAVLGAVDAALLRFEPARLAAELARSNALIDAALLVRLALVDARRGCGGSGRSALGQGAQRGGSERHQREDSFWTSWAPVSGGWTQHKCACCTYSTERQARRPTPTQSTGRKLL
ncbi:MAG: hypothetical protein U1F67_24170 [Rubrivivax sp.]